MRPFVKILGPFVYYYRCWNLYVQKQNDMRLTDNDYVRSQKPYATANSHSRLQKRYIWLKRNVWNTMLTDVSS